MCSSGRIRPGSEGSVRKPCAREAPIRLSTSHYSLATDLSQRLEQVSFHAIRDLGQILLRVLQEMRRSAMRFKRSIILILFVDEKPARLSLVSVNLVHGASRLFSGMLG